MNVDRLKPFHARADDPPAPGPVSDLGQEGEHEVELLLNCKEIRGVLITCDKSSPKCYPKCMWNRCTLPKLREKIKYPLRFESRTAEPLK